MTELSARRQRHADYRDLRCEATLGIAAARRLGREESRTPLVAQARERLNGMAALLSRGDIEAVGFAEDLADRLAAPAVAGAVEACLGSIDAMEYSPAADGLGFASRSARVRADDVARPLAVYMLTPVAPTGPLLLSVVDRGGFPFPMRTSATAPDAKPGRRRPGPVRSAITDPRPERRRDPERCLCWRLDRRQRCLRNGVRLGRFLGSRRPARQLRRPTTSEASAPNASRSRMSSRATRMSRRPKRLFAPIVFGVWVNRTPRNSRRVSYDLKCDTAWLNASAGNRKCDVPLARTWLLGKSPRGVDHSASRSTAPAKAQRARFPWLQTADRRGRAALDVPSWFPDRLARLPQLISG
jgi:hypothetical protein